MKKIGLHIFTVCFFITMLVFTFWGRQIYIQTLPEVKVMHIEEKQFEIELRQIESSVASTTMIVNALPKEAIKDSMIYVLEESDGVDVVTQRSVLVGNEYEGWIEILSGINPEDKIVYEAEQELENFEQVRCIK